MEFTDPLIAQEELPASAAKGTTAADKAADQIQHDIDSAYTAVEKKFGDLWSSASKNASDINEKYKLEEHRKQLLDKLNAASRDINDKTKLTEHLRQFETQLKSLSTQIPVPDVDFGTLTGTANSYLDTLDAKLEVVEKEAGRYVSALTSFLSNIVSIGPEAPAPQEKETLFATSVNATANYGTSRYESDLFKLHTTPALILGASCEAEDTFNADDKTTQIAQLLDRYSTTLRPLMNDVVPVKLSYNVFWCRYFQLENKLKHEQEQRKKLLDNKQSAKSSGTNDDDEFTWDDDDDDEPVDVAKDAHEIATGTAADPDADDWE